MQEFAPIKNAEGVDSAESSANLQTQRASLWLESHGVKIPQSDGSIDCVIEISPLTALDADDLNAKNLPASIKPGEHLAF